MSSNPEIKLLCNRQVWEKMGMARATYYEFKKKLSPEQTPKFPEPVPRLPVIRYLEHEVDAYILALAALRDA